MKDVLLVLFVLEAVALFWIGHFNDSSQDARLDKLEAASTVAQQPQERHSSKAEEMFFDSLRAYGTLDLIGDGKYLTPKGDTFYIR